MTDEQIARVAHQIHRAVCAATGKDAPAPDAEAPEWLVTVVGNALKSVPTDSAVAVRYVGHRDRYIDGAYGTHILFERGQSQLVPAKVAALMLAHPDVYQPGEVPPGAVLAQGEQRPQDESDEPTQIMRDSIAAMNSKAAVAQFIKTHFNQDFNPDKTKLADLKATAVQLLDRYGMD